MLLLAIAGSSALVPVPGLPGCAVSTIARSPCVRPRAPPALLVAASVPPAGAAAGAATPTSHEAELAARRSALLPIYVGVFAQMLGVGVTLSQLPLYLKAMGASASQMGMTISLFSASQMVGAPIVIAASRRFGSLALIRACLCGSALAALGTALGRSWRSVTVARMLAGLFAASVPVAQAAVADYTRPGAETALALSRVASAASLGIVVGPMTAGGVAALAAAGGVAPDLHSRVVFGATAAFIAAVLVLSSKVAGPDPAASARAAAAIAIAAGEGGGAYAGSEAAIWVPPAWAQPLCRTAWSK